MLVTKSSRPSGTPNCVVSCSIRLPGSCEKVGVYPTDDSGLFVNHLEFPNVGVPHLAWRHIREA